MIHFIYSREAILGSFDYKCLLSNSGIIVLQMQNGQNLFIYF